MGNGLFVASKMCVCVPVHKCMCVTLQSVLRLFFWRIHYVVPFTGMITGSTHYCTVLGTQSISVNKKKLIKRKKNNKKPNREKCVCVCGRCFGCINLLDHLYEFRRHIINQLMFGRTNTPNAWSNT